MYKRKMHQNNGARKNNEFRCHGKTITPLPPVKVGNNPIGVLFHMFQYARPGRTAGEEAFIEQFLMPIPNIERDEYGNHFVFVGKKPTTAFSSHTDTVHSISGRQLIGIFDKDFIARCNPESHFNKTGNIMDERDCLGADDTAGVWIMHQMIAAGVPGLYIFHRDEETGGRGSRWIAEHTPELLRGIDRAVAFDRKAYHSVITRGPGDKCSDEFARALANKLNDLGGHYRPDPSGVFTDTANYTHLVPECTNISVGYHDAHRPSEHQHIGHLDWLMWASCQLPWDELPIVRKKAEKSYSRVYHTTVTEPDPELTQYLASARGANMAMKPKMAVMVYNRKYAGIAVPLERHLEYAKYDENGWLQWMDLQRDNHEDQFDAWTPYPWMKRGVTRFVNGKRYVRFERLHSINPDDKLGRMPIASYLGVYETDLDAELASFAVKQLQEGKTQQQTVSAVLRQIPDDIDDLETTEDEEKRLEYLCKNYPDIAAEILLMLGASVQEFEDEVLDRTGFKAI